MPDFRGGYTGRFLRVDLTAQKVSVEETPEVTQWLGPRGWNASIGWNEVGPGVDAFDPENRIIFSVGPLVGTGAPTAGRMTVSTLMPRGYPTPMWASSSMGGYLGAEIKYAGYDGIVIQGQASTPCYLLVEDGEARLEDATGLWGQGTYRTQQTLKERHSEAHQIAAIGPAGENRVRFASIGHRIKNAVGNGGFGGVLGSKNLKAIVVRGTRGVPIADPTGFLDAVRYVQELVRGGLYYLGRVEAGLPNVACTHGCSVRCHTSIRPTTDRYGSGSPWRMSTCVDHTWAGGLGVSYDGQSPRGDRLLVPGAKELGDAGHDLANLADDMGITSWAHHTWGHYFSGLIAAGIAEIDGTPLEVDSPDFWHRWIMQVAHREGTGDDYAEGLARFYERRQLGPRDLSEFLESAGSRGHGWHREGRAMERHPSPYWEHSALLYAVSTRDVTPGTHGFFFLNGLYGYPSAPRSAEEIAPQLKRLAQRLYGSERPICPGDEMVEHATIWHQHRAIIKDSMGVCDYVFPTIRRAFDTQEEMEAAEDLFGDTATEAALFRPCTGIDLGISEMESPIAERIANVERCIEVRNNGRARPLDEAVISHYQYADKTDGTRLSDDAYEFRALLDRYYDLRGWDRERGWPTTEKLTELGLGVVAAVIEGMRQ
jgi:aldehyde:ferredoxin oxidoreductase